MNSLESLKNTLRQKPNSRERVIFFIAIAALCIGFVKACAMESHKAVSSLQERLDKSLAEKEQLSKPPVMAVAITGTDARSQASKMKWIGDKKSATLASDSLLKGVQDNGLLLVKFSMSDYKEKKDFLFKSVSLTLAGSLTDLGQYLEATERLPVPLVIERIALENNTEFADLITLRIEGGFYATK